MLPKSNVHTHTDFSDGRDSAEQMVQAALERGFVSLGFSDHAFTPWDEAAMQREADYRAEILRLKEKYAGQIEIALGYEHDFTWPDADLSLYEYIIESVHFVKNGDKYLSVDYSRERTQHIIDDWFAGDAYAYCRSYFDNVCASLEQIPCDVVGHIGLVSKFNEDSDMFDMTDPRYLDPSLECLRLAVEKDVLVEVNTGAMSRGYRKSPYPDLRQLQALRAMGGRVTITSDCHRAEWIDYAFDQAADLVRRAGFTEAWIWQNGKFVPYEI